MPVHPCQQDRAYQIHPCQQGRIYQTSMTVELGRRVVKSGLWPVWEYDPVGRQYVTSAVRGVRRVRRGAAGRRLDGGRQFALAEVIDLSRPGEIERLREELGRDPCAKPAIGSLAAG